MPPTDATPAGPRLNAMPAAPAAVPLGPDLLLVQHADPAGSGAEGLLTNAYGVAAEGGATLWVDAAFPQVLPAVARAAADGYRPAGLLLTHRHVAANARAVRAFVEAFGGPVFLHPADAAHPQAVAAARQGGVRYEDPATSDVLRAAGVEVIAFPGHTEGSVLLYRAADGGTLLTGDAAMGTTVD